MKTKNLGMLAVFAVIVIGIVLFSGCVKEQEIIRLEEVTPTKTPEELSEGFLPAKYPWRALKGDEKNTMFYPSYLPRNPEIKFKVNKSVLLTWSVPVSVPLVDGDRIFVGHNLNIYSLNLNGEILWSGVLGKSFYEAFDRFVNSYAVGKYFFVGASSTSGGETPSLLVAFEKENGELVWQKTFGKKGSHVTSNILVYNGKVCAGTVGGDVACFSEDGNKLWEKEVDGIVRGLAAGNGAIFVTTENGKKLYAFDISSGEIRWVYDAGNMLSTPLYVNGIVVVGTSLGEITAIKDGNLLWKKQVHTGADVNSNSYVAASEKNIYVSSMHKLYVLDLEGNIAGEFELPGNEELGRPLVSKDIVVLPVKTSKEAKVYLLWKGTTKLKEIKVLESDEVWMPSISAAYGDIYIAVRVPDMIYRLGDDEKPVIGEIKAELSNGTLKVHTTVKDERSGIYKVLLFYSNDSRWKHKDMFPSRRYVIEPVGGYGLNEEPYEAEIKINDKVELYVVAIDNVGNYATSEVKAYMLKE